MTTIKIVAFAGLFIFCSSLLCEELDSLDPEVRGMLMAGQVTNETIRADESGGAARFQIYMTAPVEKIWSVIFSCENAFVYLDGLRLCEVLEEAGNTTLTRQIVKTSWLVPAQDLTFRTERQPYTRAEFNRTSGSLREMEGSWEFTEMEEGVLVTHELRVKPTIPVPRFLIRRLMRKGMPEMLACMRAMAGGSLDDVQRAIDNKSCPGNRD